MPTSEKCLSEKNSTPIFDRFISFDRFGPSQLMFCYFHGDRSHDVFPPLIGAVVQMLLSIIGPTSKNLAESVLAPVTGSAGGTCIKAKRLGVIRKACDNNEQYHLRSQLRASPIAAAGN